MSTTQPTQPTQPANPTAPEPPPTVTVRRTILPYPLFRLFGVALAVAVSDPPHGALGSASPQVTVILVLFAVWAAAPVVRRPVLTSHRWINLFARHRNTVFVSACTLAAASSLPPVWLMITDAALVLGYLLALDAVTAGPVGVRQLKSGWPVGLAAAGTALVLGLAQLMSGPHSGGLAESGRWLAAVGAALAGGALALAFLPSRAEREAQAAAAAAKAAAAKAAAAATAANRAPGSSSYYKR